MLYLRTEVGLQMSYIFFSPRTLISSQFSLASVAITHPKLQIPNFFMLQHNTTYRQKHSSSVELID